MAYNEALTNAGAWVHGERLKPSALTTVVKVRDGAHVPMGATSSHPTAPG